MLGFGLGLGLGLQDWPRRGEQRAHRPPSVSPQARPEPEPEPQPPARARARAPALTRAPAPSLSPSPTPPPSDQRVLYMTLHHAVCACTSPYTGDQRVHHADLALDGHPHGLSRTRRTVALTARHEPPAHPRPRRFLPCAYQCLLCPFTRTHSAPFTTCLLTSPVTLAARRSLLTNLLTRAAYSLTYSPSQPPSWASLCSTGRVSAAAARVRQQQAAPRSSQP